MIYQSSITPMKSGIFPIFLFVAFIPFFSYSQQLEPPVYPDEEGYEKQDDPYLPNAYNNQKLSPAYRYDSHQSSRSGISEIMTRQVNVAANQQNIMGDAANEPNIAVNPLNENEIVIGWRQFNNVVSNFRQAGWGYSSDGGQTWTFPGSILPGVFASDPVLDFDNSGNFYYNSLMSTQQGGLPCFVYKSTNGGASWNNGVYIGGGDKQWMTIDRSDGMGEDNIYSSWTASFSDCPPGNFTRSTDGAGSFDTCSLIIEDLSWGTEAVGNNGELYICGRSPSTVAVKVAKSTDAQDPSLAPSWSSVSTANLGGFITGMTPINPVGLTGQIYIDVDRSFGPGRDNVYIVGSVQPYFNSDPADVMFNKSTDGASTWTAPVKINDDTDTTNTQWFGTMSVAPNGRIDVIWLDTRDTPGSDSSALYYSYSVDEGTTWSINEKLSESFNPHVGYPNQPKMGDYFDMVSSNAGAHVAWVHTLSGGQDVYYSFITPQEVTGIEDVSGDVGVSVFPNPTSGMLEVSWAERKVRAEIFTAVGQMVYSTDAYNTKHVIDISSQSAGMYFLKLIS
ncbi:MAG: T9SS type A sorting domain-containing protein, partial [Saprospiraceae bacterium]|nr:T9SS type A sorting domain-containing protein [Saprospiraceae bacterium]